MHKTQLYFIAIIPPEPVFGAAMGWKHTFAEKFNSKAALRSPPHITLHMPFKWREDQEERIGNALEELVLPQSPFDINLQGFGAFKPKTIFIEVVNSNFLEHLHEGVKSQMKRSLNIFNADYKDRPFHPHLTLAFRDLKKQLFSVAWEEFKDKAYQATFTVYEIVLLKHNGKSWDAHRSFPFKS